MANRLTSTAAGGQGFQGSDRASSLDLGWSLGRRPAPSKPAAQGIPAEWAEQMERLARLVH